MKPAVATLEIASLVFLALIAASCRNHDTSNSEQREERQYPQAEFTVLITRAANGTYGYDILRNGRLVIHQPHIPAIPGYAGFGSDKDARKVAELVVRKMQLNTFPPTISVSELDSLGVLRTQPNER